MRKYPLYKPSGIEWLGQFPDNWSFRTIRRITREHRQGYYIAEDYLEDGVKLVRITDLHENGDIDYSEMPYVKITPENEKGYSILEGDFLFPRTGSIGLLGYVKQPERSVFASYLIRFRFKNKEILSDFLYYYFISDVFISGIFSDLHGGVNQNIHAENIKDQYIVFPSNLKEQHSIVRFLDYKTTQIDSFIANRQKQIELLKEQLQKKILIALSKGISNRDFKATNLPWFPEIPVNWDITKFNAAIKLLHGFQFRENHFKEDGVRVVKITQLKADGTLDLSEASYVDEKCLTTFPNKIIRTGDILMALTGGTIGKIIRVDDLKEEVLQNYRVGKFIPKDLRNLDKEYMFWVLSSEFTYAQILFLQRETGQPNIGIGDFSKMFFPMPDSLNEQIEISKFIAKQKSETETIISKYQKQIELMQEYRTSLISQAVTGKIDVRDWKPKIKEYSIEKPDNLLVAEE